MRLCCSESSDERAAARSSAERRRLKEVSTEFQLFDILRKFLHERGKDLDMRGTAEVIIPLEGGDELNVPIAELRDAPE